MGFLSVKSSVGEAKVASLITLHDPLEQLDIGWSRYMPPTDPGKLQQPFYLDKMVRGQRRTVPGESIGFTATSADAVAANGYAVVLVPITTRSESFEAVEIALSDKDLTSQITSLHLARLAIARAVIIVADRAY